MRAPGRGDVRVDGIGRQVVRRAVAACREHDGVAFIPLDRAGDKIAADDPARLAVGEHEIEHLAAREHPHSPFVHLPHQRLIGAEQELLAGLAPRVEGPRHLRTTE